MSCIFYLQHHGLTIFDKKWRVITFGMSNLRLQQNILLQGSPKL